LEILGITLEALGLEKLKPKVAQLRLDVCWLVPSLMEMLFL
jgi:hypothetical protein